MESREFYNALAKHYHLIATDWDQAVIHQGKLISNLIEHYLGRGTHRVLDCSCGIGTQAIGLALNGHHVTGTDISEIEIEHARAEAKRLGANVVFQVADMRSLPHEFEERFDTILSFDNAVAHLLDEGSLSSFFESSFRTLKKGGVFVMSMRDYDKLSSERPPGMLPRIIKDANGERVYVQTWEWTADSRFYDMSLFLLENKGDKWEAAPLKTRMRAHLRHDLSHMIETVGFVQAKWLSPTESGYYQQILLARKP